MSINDCALPRRSFLKRAALTAGALSAARFLPGPNLLHAADAAKLNCAVIGCGGRGMSHLNGAVNENIVAIVDPDEKRHAVVKKWAADKGKDPEKLRVFKDYRELFNKMGRSLDVVFIATPNHHHALPATLAMQLNKAVYCEKPLCHNVGEARRLRELARKSKAPTQMGNQGHCQEGYIRLCEYLAAGVIGRVTETHSWTDRANGGRGPRPPVEAPPPGLDWDVWIGPAPYRDFHSDLHPHEWHGWYDFGNGSIGNMGCHVLDGMFWGLKVGHPTAVEAEEIRDGSDERYPMGSRIRWDVPARGDLPPLKVYWYEGLRKDATEGASGSLRTAKGKARNLPPLFDELEAKHPDEEFESNGTFYVGDKGIIYTGTYGDRMHIVPWEKMKEIPAPAKSLPRPQNIMNDFLEACRSGRKETAAGFEYGAQLTEFTLLANLAQRAGVGRKVEWDGPNMKVVNRAQLNPWLDRKGRTGWQA